MYIIDNRAVTQMLTNPEIVSHFPFLTLTEEKAECCNRPAGRVPRYEAIRANIAYLSEDQKKVLKRLLGVGQAKVYHRTAQGVVGTII